MWVDTEFKLNHKTRRTKLQLNDRWLVLLFNVYHLFVLITKYYIIIGPNYDMENIKLE